MSEMTYVLSVDKQCWVITICVSCTVHVNLVGCKLLLWPGALHLAVLAFGCHCVNVDVR